ncbi:MAG: TlpA family protein disulfide reductase, partial [Planctomycetia bacterium]|nr:TlpA family protein disulfide reductase [Planctomycetia bacterium]
NKKLPAEWTADEILAQLLTRYRQAKTYRDNAVVVLSFRRAGQPMAEEAPAAVAFERPGKLSIVAYQATVKCDGKELKARIDDPPSNNLEGQVVVRPAPTQIKLADLADDRLLYDILGSRLGRQPIQLELLLETRGLVAALGADVACRRLTDATHGGRACFRVEVPSAAGPLTFWVDHSDSLLRRLDFPAATLVPDAAQDPSVTNLELFADLRDANIDGSIPDSQFALDVPASAKRMKRFARPLQPLPTKLLGQRPQPFFFTQLDGGRLSDIDLHGKIAVLTWYHDNPACEATLQQVSQAFQRADADGSVVFLAVATDPTAVKNEEIQNRLADWKVLLPVVRDLEAFGDKSFHIEGHPTVVILDQRGGVQHFQVGGNPELADQLFAMLGRLKRGDDLAAELLSQRASAQRRYEELVARGGPEPDELLDIPEAVIRRRSEPKKLQIKPLWTNAEL